tara:strand:- start:1258 stop:1461 length:204 start_codon:yes stop_codon:yes gene_type:complete
MLPGSEFGINENKLIARIAFVDFDGKEALKLANNQLSLSDDFLKKACPKIIKGINKICDWIDNDPSL